MLKLLQLLLGLLPPRLLRLARLLVLLQQERALPPLAGRVVEHAELSVSALSCAQVVLAWQLPHSLRVVTGRLLPHGRGKNAEGLGAEAGHGVHEHLHLVELHSLRRALTLALSLQLLL